MQNVLAAWTKFDARRRTIVIGSTAAIFVALLAMSQLGTGSSMALLFGGLETRTAGEVIAALEQENAPFEVRGNAIFVESADRDRLRMVLAGQGLPSQGSAGYELLDGLSGFGTTAQMFDATYWRAKEGELARTILSSPRVRSARVHISKSPTNGFRRIERPSASVYVTATSGSVPEDLGRAFRSLVASSVTGLQPEDVSVIDGATGRMLGDDSTSPNVFPKDRTEALRQNVMRIVEARVGPGNAVVEASVELVTESESIIERRFDPDSRVAISTETEEQTRSSQGQSGGAVTVASNLPDGDAGSEGATNSSQNSQTRERVNFEVSETKRELIRKPGDVRRLSIAVLVNGSTTIDDSGTEQTVPRSAEELETLKELVSAAVGFDDARGDQISIKSLAFEPVPERGTAATPLGQDAFDRMAIVRLVVLAAVILVLAFFVVRPALLRKQGQDQPSPVALDPESETPRIGGKAESGLPALTGEISDGGATPALPAIRTSAVPGENQVPVPAIAGVESADPVERLRQMIRERQDETVEVLRSWMDDSGEKA